MSLSLLGRFLFTGACILYIRRIYKTYSNDLDWDSPAVFDFLLFLYCRVDFLFYLCCSCVCASIEYKRIH